MLFLLFRKSYIFWFFLFSKKFIINHKKNRKTNNLNSKNKLLSAKSQKNKHHIKGWISIKSKVLLKNLVLQTLEVV